MRFHAEIPLVALLARMHFRVACFVFVLGRGWRRNQGGIDHGAGFDQQAALNQDVVDGGQNLFCEIVFFQPVPKTQSGGLVRQPGERIELGELTPRGGINSPDPQLRPASGFLPIHLFASP